MTVINVITVIVARKPLIYAVLLVTTMTMRVTVHKYNSDSPSCRKPYRYREKYRL